MLRQLAATVEQLRAAVVVEMLGRQFLERPRQPVEHIVGEPALRSCLQVTLDHALRESRARDKRFKIPMASTSPSCLRSGRPEPLVASAGAGQAVKTWAVSSVSSLPRKYATLPSRSRQKWCMVIDASRPVAIDRNAQSTSR